jgi:hypothetical protein
MEKDMDLSFDLKTVHVEIRGEELIVDGVHGPSALDQMMSQYEDDIGVRTSALRIADLVFSAGQTIDKTTAEVIVQEMAMLAHDMLHEQATEWDTPTLEALRKIRATFPELEAAE